MAFLNIPLFSPRKYVHFQYFAETSRYDDRDAFLSLDFDKVIEIIAQYSTTRRGRDALFSLVKKGDKPFVNRFSTLNPRESKRKDLLSNFSSAKYVVNKMNKMNDIKRSYSSIIKLAVSVDEVQSEHHLVSSAISILSAHESRGSKSDYQYLISLPPIYSNESPFDLSNNADSDDDEWLLSILYGTFTGLLEFENILQAEQIVKRILDTSKWSSFNTNFSENFALSTVFEEIDVETLEHVYNHIKNKVKIVKGAKTFNDPSGTMSYEFKLNEDLFPNLAILKRKEKGIINRIEVIMSELMSNKKYVSQLSGLSRKNPEPYEFDGRLVVAVPKDIASSLGSIRGYSKENGLCFVEPKEIVHLGNELYDLRMEINEIGNEIKRHLTSTILQSSLIINKGLDAVARMDCIFARAAFGVRFNGVLPNVGSDGVIDINGFLHPVLSSQIGEKTVPIDILLSDENGERCLIISGPNGGGKSLAMKSFGLCVMMNKLSIPLLLSNTSIQMKLPRVDYFDKVITDFGDRQSLIHGESTYMSTLNSLSHMLEFIKSSSHYENEAPMNLVLLDELGGGTEPESGGFIAQAILEEIIQNRSVRTVVTTHSTVLKSLALVDDRFNCASVLLQSGKNEDGLPTFKLCYGIIGNSHALAAASRAMPPLPESVLDRAANLIASSNNGGTYVRAMTAALEKEKYTLSKSLDIAEEHQHDMLRCREGLLSLSRSYSQRLSNIEYRLDTMMNEMKDQHETYELLGNSLASLRLVKKQLISNEYILQTKGMRVVALSDVFKGGEKVVVISGDYEGESGTIIMSDVEKAFDELLIELDIEHGLAFLQSYPRKFKRRELAVWDYPRDSRSSFRIETGDVTPSISQSKNNLMQLLNNLDRDVSNSKSIKRVDSAGIEKSEGRYNSSRERKANSKKRKANKK